MDASTNIRQKVRGNEIQLYLQMNNQKFTYTLLYFYRVREYKKTVVFLISLLLVMTALCRIQGPHQEWVALIRSNVWWVVYWTGLGVLSSVGLGTGLHTFLLYLGPHIAAVTIAAYECGALNFPEPPYPEDIICPTEPDPRMAASIWNIMSKVR